ncbi:MAG: Rieske (2Fe-2S) protein [Candidatus Poribacteria bacterium]|nr:Rieske (2Fe-2S) protein [Candidatus Poribacteria bacterium]
MSSRTFDIGPAEAFPIGEPRRVAVNGRALAVVRQPNAIYAARDVCPHQGARLSDGHATGTALPCLPGEEIVFGKIGEILVCPWHGWEYDLRTGRSLIDPEKTRIRTYPARIENGRALVEM